MNRFVSKAIVSGLDDVETPLPNSANDDQDAVPHKPQQPVYDGRTLYERLQEQKDRKEEEFLAKTKFGTNL